MTIQEVQELVLSKVPEEKKEEFIAAIAACKTKAEKLAVLEKYGVQLTEKELEVISSHEIADADLDQAVGGCAISCGPLPCCETIGIMNS